MTAICQSGREKSCIECPQLLTNAENLVKTIPTQLYDYDIQNLQPNYTQHIRISLLESWAIKRIGGRYLAMRLADGSKELSKIEKKSDTPLYHLISKWFTHPVTENITPSPPGSARCDCRKEEKCLSVWITIHVHSSNPQSHLCLRSPYLRPSEIWLLKELLIGHGYTCENFKTVAKLTKIFPIFPPDPE